MRRVLLITSLFLFLLPYTTLALENLSVEISIEKCILLVFENHADGSKDLVAEYPVGTPKRGLRTFPFGKGFATKVIFQPYWYPTNGMVEYMNKNLRKDGKKAIYKKGEAIAWNDPRNKIGTFKIILSHKVPGKPPIYRIHGTDEPEKIGKRVSGGCIRMRNEDGILFAKIIEQQLKEGRKVPVIITM